MGQSPTEQTMLHLSYHARACLAELAAACEVPPRQDMVIINRTGSEIKTNYSSWQCQQPG